MNIDTANYPDYRTLMAKVIYLERRLSDAEAHYGSLARRIDNLEAGNSHEQYAAILAYHCEPPARWEGAPDMDTAIVTNEQAEMCAEWAAHTNGSGQA